MHSFQVHELAEKVVAWSNEYARYSEEYGKILAQKAIRWTEFRAQEDCKSDKMADKWWDTTPEGIKEMSLRLKMKALEKQMSAARSLIRVAEGEARNQF